ncbi:MAG TPA: TRAP transporter small permease subunit [Paracoccaceae bacterium]|nr:TRAP transporter small permease subunit [Paracoccaceae bacterium]HMO71615.1 TRAP transporter small permease subunit [Paracoccaceae bacterium]
MPAPLIALVRHIEALNRAVGRLAMFLLFALMAVMLAGALSRAVWVPQVWTDETGQFLLMGYFMLGGAYAMQLGSSVRMDVFYSAWRPGTRALVDCVTIFALLFYLSILLWGGVESLQYAVDYGERRPGLWRPYMWPVKAVMVAGIVLMILQALCFLIRDIMRLRGIEIAQPGPETQA